MTIFHGSEHIIKEPKFGAGRPYNDYGLGFYATPSKELAGEWAVLNTEVDGYVNEYTFNVQALNTLKLGNVDIKHTLAILLKHRGGSFSDVVSERRKKFIKMFHVDLSPYDVVEGWRADDSFFSFIRDFLSAGLSLENLERAMKFGELGEQICLKSEWAFRDAYLNFVTAHKASVNEFYRHAKDRDDRARDRYRQMPNKGRGTIIFDIIGRD